MTSSQSFLLLSLVLTPVGFQLVIWFCIFQSHKMPHHFILCDFIYLSIYFVFVNFCNSLLFLIIYPSLIFDFQKLINYLWPIQTVPRFHVHRLVLALSVSCKPSLVYLLNLYIYCVEISVWKVTVTLSCLTVEQPGCHRIMTNRLGISFEASLVIIYDF